MAGKAASKYCPNLTDLNTKILKLRSKTKLTNDRDKIYYVCDLKLNIWKQKTNKWKHIK